MSDQLSDPSNPASPSTPPWEAETTTAVIVLADGTVIKGKGAGSEGVAVGEICFNTAMTGYQEILTDPSYAGQIITFTFPHIGNVGTNDEDMETSNDKAESSVLGAILRAEITTPSNYRSKSHFDNWLKDKGIIAISGIDTRALTALIREKGMQNGVIAHAADGVFDLDALKKQAADWAGIEGADLAKDVSITEPYEWNEKRWEWDKAILKKPHRCLTSSRSIAAQNVTSSAASPPRAARSRSCRLQAPLRTSSNMSRMASSSPTALATRQQPVSMSCLK